MIKYFAGFVAALLLAGFGLSEGVFKPQVNNIKEEYNELRDTVNLDTIRPILNKHGFKHDTNSSKSDYRHFFLTEADGVDIFLESKSINKINSIAQEIKELPNITSAFASQESTNNTTMYKLSIKFDNKGYK